MRLNPHVQICGGPESCNDPGLPDPESSARRRLRRWPSYSTTNRARASVSHFQWSMCAVASAIRHGSVAVLDVVVRNKIQFLFGTFVVFRKNVVNLIDNGLGLSHSELVVRDFVASLGLDGFSLRIALK